MALHQSISSNFSHKHFFRTYVTSIADLSSTHLTSSDLFVIDVSMKIIRTSPKLLLHALTENEIYRLSQLFLSLIASPEEPYISRQRVSDVFETYCKKLLPSLNIDSDYLGELNLRFHQ